MTQALNSSLMPQDISPIDVEFLRKALQETIDLALHVHILIRAIHDDPDGALGHALEATKLAQSVHGYLSAYALSRAPHVGTA